MIYCCLNLEGSFCSALPSPVLVNICCFQQVLVESKRGAVNNCSLIVNRMVLIGLKRRAVNNCLLIVNHICGYS
jgi:hypothetical protein